MTSRGAGCVLAMLLAAPTLAAQQPHFGAGISVSQMRVHSSVVDVDEALDGSAVGLELSGRLGVGFLTVEYLQAQLAPGTPLTIARDVSEGAVLVGIEPWTWLRLSTGVHRRHFATDAGAQRWTLWEMRLRAQAPLVPRLANGYAELRPAITGAVSFPGAWGSGFGGEAGFVAGLATFPAWLRVGYRIERYTLDDGARTETTDGLVVTLGIARR